MEAPAELSAADAARHLAHGGLVAFPTETSWGLAADARSAPGLTALRDWKGREGDQPVSVLLEAPDALAELDVEMGAEAARLAARFWPGPLTLVLSTAGTFAPGVTAPDGGLGVRCSPHPDATALAAGIAAIGAGPVTATSLNRSGEPAATRRAEARRLCAAAPGPALLAGGECGGGPPSSVVDCSVRPPRILREAAISRDAIAAVIAEAS